MAISKCLSLSNSSNTATGSSNPLSNINESYTHGSAEFPIAAYHDDVTSEYVNWHWHQKFEAGFVLFCKSASSHIILALFIIMI